MRKLDTEYRDFMDELGNSLLADQADAMQTIFYAILSAGVLLAIKTLEAEGTAGLGSLLAEIKAFQGSMSHEPKD